MSCADCAQSLQSPLDDQTWVSLPVEVWLDEWFQRFGKETKLAVQLAKSLYGHPLAGKLWQEFLEREVLALGGAPLEAYPSNYMFRWRSVTLILNIYVDDLTLAGGTRGDHQSFSKAFKTKIKIDPEEYIGNKCAKILGRMHSLHRSVNSSVVTMIYDTRSYAKGTVDMYCEPVGITPESLRKVSTPCLPESLTSDQEIAQEGELHKIAEEC